MSERQIEAQEEKKVFPLDPFGHAYAGDPGVNLWKPTIKQFGIRANHELARLEPTLENMEDIDLYQITQSYKCECGLELMKTLIKTGVADPGDFQDDGTMSGDDTLPTDINTLSEVLAADGQKVGKLVQALGGSVEEAIASNDLDGYIKNLVAAAVAAQQQPQQPQQSAEGEAK